MVGLWWYIEFCWIIENVDLWIIGCIVFVVIDLLGFELFVDINRNDEGLEKWEEMGKKKYFVGEYYYNIVVVKKFYMFKEFCNKF